MPNRESHTRIDRVIISSVGRAIVPPLGIVYSTAPWSVTSNEGIDYVRKGPELNVVIAELVAHLLARVVGVPIPDFAICEDGDCVHFLSEKLKDCMRNVEPWLKRNRQQLVDQVCRIIAFDIWIMNPDRNMGNLLGLPANDGSSISIIAIDFEKSASLRGRYPLTEAAQVLPSSFWPTGDLGNIARGAPFPADFVKTIQETSDEKVTESVRAASAVLGDSFSWADSSIKILLDRKQKMATLAREVWQ